MANLLVEAKKLPEKADQNCPLVVIQCIEDPLFYGLFASLMLELRRTCGARGALLLARSINGAVGVSWLAMIARSLPLAWMITSQWARVNRNLVGPVAYRSHSLRHPFWDIMDIWRSWKIWRRLRRADDILNLKIDGVHIGDLVVDSYLRFRPSPRFNVGDRFVWRVLWQTLRDLRRACHYFKMARPALYLSNNSTYVEHGVPVRVALSLNIPVRVFGNLAVFGKLLTQDDVFQTKDTSDYRRVFESLENPHHLLNEADKELAFRLSGGVDSATSYMKASAYSQSEETVPDVSGAVVVFMHDFYDSPHIYADLIFVEFWAWISCTINTLTDAGVPFWLKPHPNQIALSNEALHLLQETFPQARLLSSKITNIQLVKAGMLCGVTVYGTVAHELAYMGIPSIACARHPHHAFDFCRTARSVAEYQAYLRTPSVSPLSSDEMRRQALAFYYMHNLFGNRESRELRRTFSEIWRLAHSTYENSGQLAVALDHIRTLPGWHDYIRELSETLTTRTNTGLETPFDSGGLNPHHIFTREKHLAGYSS